jgi:hypothetical protein
VNESIVGYEFCPACGNEHSPRPVPVADVTPEFFESGRKFYVVDTGICDACFGKADGTVPDPFFVVEVVETHAELKPGDLPLIGRSICMPRQVAEQLLGIGEDWLDDHVFLHPMKFGMLLIEIMVLHIFSE